MSTTGQFRQVSRYKDYLVEKIESSKQSIDNHIQRVIDTAKSNNYQNKPLDEVIIDPLTELRKELHELFQHLIESCKEDHRNRIEEVRKGNISVIPSSPYGETHGV